MVDTFGVERGGGAVVMKQGGGDAGKCGVRAQNAHPASRATTIARYRLCW